MTIRSLRLQRRQRLRMRLGRPAAFAQTRVHVGPRLMSRARPRPQATVATSARRRRCVPIRTLPSRSPPTARSSARRASDHPEHELGDSRIQNAWRSWSGGTRVASYRLPDELLAELASTSAELQLQVGLIVTAAIAHLLDEPDDVIAALVDRADDARIQGRRATRRGLGTTPRSRSASEAGATL